MNELHEVIASYGIQPKSIEQLTPSVFRIGDGVNEYALKKSKLTQETAVNWEQVYHDANHYGLAEILPVFPTIDQSLFWQSEGSVFYLSPWINEQDDQAIKKLYEAIGSIHHKTKFQQQINKQNMVDNFHAYQTKHTQTRAKLISLVEKFETEHYMAPIGLQVCTQYRDIEVAIKLLMNRIQQFLDNLEDDDQEDDWAFSLCHGQLSFDHFLSTAGNHYLINWEMSSYNYSFYDLVSFFKHETQHYHARKNKMIKEFPVYMAANELEANELNLLLIYLLDPTQYIAEIEKFNSEIDGNMIKLTKRLQRLYRIICFGIELSQFVETTYERIFTNTDDN